LTWESEPVHTVQIQENENLEVNMSQPGRIPSCPKSLATHQWGDISNSGNRKPHHTLRLIVTRGINAVRAARVDLPV
jgi:hypothetical protein